MGIQGLTKLIRDNCPGAIKEGKLKQYTGMKVAIDASNALYQFMVAIRSMGQAGGASAQLTNEAGEVTSHLQGMFARTIRMMELGIKPVWVFDGKPPALKGGELAKRSKAKAKAKADLAAAKESGNAELIERYSKRTVRVTTEHNADVKTLFKLMGVPVVEAPCEAEAQCAALARSGKVYAAASEDMDTLCFTSPVLLRKFSAAESKKLPVLEINLNRVLEGLGFTHSQFVDLCILMGCDYMGTIRGVGPKTALNLIRKHGNIEGVLANLGPKYQVPEDFNFHGARQLFHHHEVLDPADMPLRFGTPDREGLLRFLVDEKGFNPERVGRQIDRLEKARGKATQRRLDTFFTRKPQSAGSKRKAIAAKGKKNAKKKKQRR